MQGITVGHFDEQGNACLKFHIRGVAPDGLELSGIIDTGFTGFIQLPIEHAFRLRLPLEGSVESTLADDSNTSSYTALGTVVYDGVEQEGVVILETVATSVLIGMAFLRQFKLSLNINSKQVMLLNEDWMNQYIEKAQRPSIESSDGLPHPGDLPK